MQLLNVTVDCGDGGSGIELYDSSLTYTNGTVTGCPTGIFLEGGGITTNGVSFLGTGAVAGTAVVLRNGAVGNVVNSTFRENVGAQGGAIYTDVGGPLTIIDSTFELNSASQGGRCVC